MAAPAEITFAPLLLGGIGLMVLVAGAFVWFVVSYQQRLYRQQLVQRAAESAHQQALLAAVIEAQEAERARIGRDLHDDVASSVAMAQMLVERLAVPDPADDPAALFAVAREVLAAAVADVRSTSHQLYPASLARVGLVKALERLADLSRHSENLNVQFEAHYPHTLPPAAELALYRICQELVHNALKHAHGARVLRIGLRQESARLVLAVEDDGCGFVPEQPGAAALAGAGVGLRSIGARVQLLGARLVQRTAPGQGTRTQVELDHAVPEK
ncbi:histidine kinase [Hymenobacter sp. DH14]|uniref:Oxygen sensor histidine kinase NreB n=1 Tax=Hymenobacter cyanobacteriorum TaxID=2926463 RepID=A0A9X2AHP3_9BACT|nr:ATP-binding protein [Hymenobacter cyanobacteriorum]MCI1189113.1 histidine kinase [Hymenobacter cyanobacteriorum]